jgi:hypothetical protein
VFGMSLREIRNDLFDRRSTGFPLYKANNSVPSGDVRAHPSLPQILLTKNPCQRTRSTLSSAISNSRMRFLVA